jgi:hypothetical protein
MTYADHLPSSMRPTPGPWACEQETGRVYFADGDVEPTIAFVTLENTSSGQSRADAQLIAAAPELREAIPPLIRLVHRLLPMHAQSDSTLDNMPEIIQARAALAKSTLINPTTKERTMP